MASPQKIGVLKKKLIYVVFTISVIVLSSGATWYFDLWSHIPWLASTTEPRTGAPVPPFTAKPRIPFDGPTIGTDGPILPIAVSPDGGWIAFCQAREDSNKDGRLEVKVDFHGAILGDRMETYLTIGAGLGEKIGAFISYDPTGRYLVVLSLENRLLLIDTQTNRRTDLTKNDREPDPLRGYGLASFDDQGKRVAYLSKAGTKSIAVVRTLSTGEEQVIHHGEGRLWRTTLFRSALVMEVIARDTDGNGKLEFPKSITHVARRQCRKPSAIGHYGDDGDTPDKRVAHLDGGTLQDAPAGLIRPLGDGLLVRESDGSIHLLKGEDDSELVPSSCDGWLRDVDAERERVFVTCQQHLEVHGRDIHHRFSEDVPVNEFSSDRWSSRPGRLAIFGNWDASIIDKETLTVVHRGTQLRAPAGSFFLEKRSDGMMLYELNGDERHLLHDALVLSSSGYMLHALGPECGPRMDCGPLAWFPPSEMTQ